MADSRWEWTGRRASARDGRIVITGGAGFIGHHLANALIGEGYDVVVVDNLCVKPLLPIVGTFVKKSVSELTTDDLRDVACVYHLASWKSVPGSFDEPLQYVENVHAATHLLDLVVRCAVPRMIVTTTCEVYGISPQLPTPESAPLLPRSPYAVSKAAVDMLAQVYQRTYGLDLTVVRLFNVYGPGERPDAVVPRFCELLMRDQALPIEGNGFQQRDFSYITDIVWMLRQLMCPPTHLRTVNLGSGEATPILDLAQMLIEINRRGDIAFAPERLQEIPSFCADMSTVRAVLDTPSSVPLADGLRETYQWWKSYSTRM